MRTISHVQNTDDGMLVAHGTDDKGVSRQIPLVDVRASVYFPTGSTPGYYLVMGRKQEITPTGKHPVLFLAEGNELSHTLLFQRLTDQAPRLKCRMVFANQGTGRAVRSGVEGAYGDLWAYLRAKRLSHLKLTPAPAADDIEYGKALVAEYVKDRAMDLPEFVDTTLKGQLRAMVDTGDAADPRFFAFHALRYLMVGFAKFFQAVTFINDGRVPASRMDARGWT